MTHKPPPGMYGRALGRIRDNLRLAQQKKFGVFGYRKYSIDLPQWFQRADLRGPLAAQYADHKHLLRRGKLIWGAVVQANTHLYEQGDDNHSAAIVYCDNPKIDDSPWTVGAVAYKLFDARIEGTDDHYIREFVDALRDEHTQMLRRVLPRHTMYDMRGYYASLVVHRSKLPGGRLAGKLLPVIVGYENITEAVTLLPADLWDEEFMQYNWID